MNYVLVGLNHKTAPLAIREKLALDHTRSRHVLTRLLEYPQIREAAVISTCNRVEFYSAAQSPQITRDILTKVLLEPLYPSSSDLNATYCKQDNAAVRHLFEVAASLDSQVTGENQITHQVKQAHQLALEHSATGYYLNTLFNRALYVAKRVRSETEISQGHVSAGSIAVELAKKIFGSLQDKSVLLLGTGEVGELTIRCLASQQVKNIIVCNRTFAKAKELERAGLGTACAYSDMMQMIAHVDMLITSTSHPLSELNKSSLSEIMKERRNQQLFIIDLGVPRNIQDKIELHNVYVYNLDDLGEIAAQNSHLRARAVQAAKNIIDEEVRLFYENHFDLKTLSAITGLAKKFDAIRREELKKTLKPLVHLSETEKETIDRLTQVLISRVLHEPIRSLKDKKNMNKGAVLSLVRQLFRLDDENFASMDKL